MNLFALVNGSPWFFGPITFSGSITFAGTALLANGSTTAPSIAFANDTDTGLFLYGPNQLGFATNGDWSLVFASSGTIYGREGNNRLSMGLAGGISLVASGTNQNVTLTPSGTGFTVIQGVGSKTSIGDFPLVTSYAALYQGVTTPGSANYTVASNGQELVLNAPSASYQIRFQVGSEVARITSAGNLLIGTVIDGGQKLQVAGTATITGALSIGNTVQTAAAVASTHKVTIVIGGATYYLLATNV